MEKKNLLYVDDEPINLQLFKFNFRQHYNLFLAQSAMEGLEILQKEDVSIVISDFKMPEMNGLDFLRK
ncbi:MAG: response regulator [Marinilabiliaceae bacterium]|nr:response regulator [Marinilabiliaceae bacterium]